MSRTLKQTGSGPSKRKTSVPPRFGDCAARAARSRNGEERDGNRCGEGYSASHQFSAFQNGFQGRNTKFRTEVSYAAVKMNWIERDRRDVTREPPVGSVEDTGVSTLVEDPVGLVEIGGDEPLAVAGEILRPTAAVDTGTRCNG